MTSNYSRLKTGLTARCLFCLSVHPMLGYERLFYGEEALLLCTLTPFVLGSAGHELRAFDPSPSRCWAVFADDLRMALDLLNVCSSFPRLTGLTALDIARLSVMAKLIDVYHTYQLQAIPDGVRGLERPLPMPSNNNIAGVYDLRFKCQSAWTVMLYGGTERWLENSARSTKDNSYALFLRSGLLAACCLEDLIFNALLPLV